MPEIAGVQILPHKKQIVALVVLIVLTMIALEVTGVGPKLQQWAAAGVSKIKSLFGK